jgi:tetratricopeptide (TPR) repeat protein
LGLAAAVSLLALACGGGGGDLEERLSAIRARQDEGKAAETITELSELRERYGDNAELDYRLGLAMVASGRTTEAVFPLHNAADSEEWAVPAGILLASTLANTNNHAEALRAADRVLEREPEHEAALMLRATSAAQLHDGKIALESADRLVAKAPDNRNYVFVRASALAEVARLDDAERVYRELLDADWQDEPQGKVRACSSFARFLIEKRKDTDRAVELMKDCVEKSPEDIQMVAALGNMLNEFERREDLIAILESAIERHPDARPLADALVGQLVADGRLNDAKQLSENWASEADDAKSWGRVASVRRRIGDLEGALEAVNKAQELADSELGQELAFFRAELLLELGRLEEAEQEATKIDPGLSLTILEARLAQQRGDLKRALELYGQVSIQWPQNHAVRALAARAAYQLGDTERAKSDLLEATRQAPKETDAALWLAQIYFAEGNMRQCLAFASRHVTERGVLDATAHLLSAEALAVSNRAEDAIKLLEEFATLRDGAFRTTAWAAIARLRARTDPAKAVAELEREIAAARIDLGDPVHVGLLDTVVDLQLRAGRGADASRRVAALIAKHPESGHFHAMLGRVALAQGRGDEAGKSFERALALQPSEGVALSGLALLQREQGDLAKAIETMKQASAAVPQSAEYAYMAARMTLEQGDRAGARQQFERVLLDHPESAGAANDLAFLLAEDASDLPLAQRYAERAVRMQPSAETLDTLGYVKLRQGAAEEAVGMFERALSRNPDYATARYHLALALIEKGEPVAARQALEQALASPFPEQQEARKVLAKIDGGEARP